MGLIFSPISCLDKWVHFIPPDEICDQCGYKPLKPTTAVSKRFIVDLVLSKNGLKKTRTQYSGTKGYCQRCKKSYVPVFVRQFRMNEMYGHGFGAWIVYQRVALRLPYESIIESAGEQFKEKLSIAQPAKFLKQFAHYYADTENALITNLLSSSFIHADETKANIKGENWYVWVFTSEQHVLFRLTETRETTIVHELLRDYRGVLVSDFYPGYDSLPCRQQKCWVHLIRDLNDDLLANPHDREFEELVSEIRDLIIPIMETIQKYGLKARNLSKFKKDLARFYRRVIEDKRYKSDLVQKYQKRFVRYKDSLFTFLEEDGIPWNNNAAERAIRSFALQRDISRSPLQEETTRHYLRLLSIRQTCRFQGKSFFQFLFSGEQDLDSFKRYKR